MTMKYRIAVLLCASIVLGAPAHSPAAPPGVVPFPVASAESGQTADLQDKTEQNEDVVHLLSALQKDPDIQALLADPEAMNAVLSMDMNFIEKDPRFRKLRENPNMRKILKLMNQ
jgi:hypothetical protein